MSLVLAIEPDAKQASILKRVVRERARAEITVVDSKDAAIAALAAHPPDLILVTALLSPRDEEDLVAHLRTLGDESDHLQTITIPLLAAVQGLGDEEDGFFKKTFGKRNKSAASAVGCDPWTFAEQVAGYLKTATEARAARQAELEYAQRHKAHALETPAAETALPISEPAFIEPEPMIVMPEPVVAEPEPLFIQPPVTAAAEATLVEPEPVYVVPEPVYAAPEPVFVGPEPAEPLIFPEPVVPEPEPVAIAPEPIVLPEPIVVPEPIAAIEPPEPVVVPEPIVAAAPPDPVYQTPPERVFDRVFEQPRKKPKAKKGQGQAKPAPAQKPALKPVPVPSPPPEPEPVLVFKPLKRLPPLAMWARVEELAPLEPEPVAAKSEDDIAELFASLRVPPHVLPVTYPHRPHLRRVRAAA